MRNQKKSSRVLGAAVLATVGFSLAETNSANADVSLGSSWVSNGTGYDSFHDYNTGDVLTPTVRAGGNTWLKVDLHDQYYSDLAADTNPGLTVTNIAANPLYQFDLDMTEWTWPSMYGFVEYYSVNPAGGGFIGSIVFSNNSAAYLNAVNHLAIDMTPILSPGGQTRAETTDLNIGLFILPAFGTGGPFTSLSQHYYVDNVVLTPATVAPTIGSGNWKTPGSGTWSGSIGANWDPAVPNAADNVATFGTFGGTINVPTTVTVAGGVTVGTINFDNTNSFTINGSAITLNTATTGTHDSLNAINVLSGSHTINSQVVKGDNANPLTFNVVQASSTLTIPNLFAQYYTFTKEGAGKLVVNRAQNVTLFVNGGTVQMIPNGAGSNASAAYYLQVAAGAKLDLTNNGFVYDYSGASPQNDVRTMLQGGFAGGSWTGNGITSSTAAAVAGIHKTAIGYADTADPGVADTITNFTGQTIDADTILMRYTLAGDFNLDLTVDSNDFTALGQNFGATGAHWFTGDFNYDGVTNALDFNAVATNFGTTLPAPALGSLVPEPATLSIAAIVSLLGLRRRYR